MFYYVQYFVCTTQSNALKWKSNARVYLWEEPNMGGTQKNFVVVNSGGGWEGGRGWGRLGKTGGGINCGNLGEGSGGRDFPWDTNTYIENSLRLFRLLGYLSTNIICSEKQTVFWKRNWGIFGQVIWLDQSRASENIWWIINKKYPQSGTKIYYDILSVDIIFFLKS